MEEDEKEYMKLMIKAHNGQYYASWAILGGYGNYPDHEKNDDKRLNIQTLEKMYGSYEDTEWKETRERHSPKAEWLLGSLFWSNNHNPECRGIVRRTIYYVFLSLKLSLKFEEIQIRIYSPNPAAFLLVESKMGAIAMTTHQQLQMRFRETSLCLFWLDLVMRVCFF